MGKEITGSDYRFHKVCKQLRKCFSSSSVPAILLESVLQKVVPLKETVLLGLEFAAYVSTVCSFEIDIFLF